MSKTHYEVLGVNELAGGAKIKRHYYELCKKYHPDVAGGDAQKMVAINEAYRVLSDPTLKSGYDRELASTRREAAFAHTAQQAKTKQAASQTAWQDVAFEPEDPVFRQATQRTAKNKHTGVAWFMAVSGIFAVALIAVSYLAPFPKAATATSTTETPSIATTDSNTDTIDQTSASTTTNSGTTDPDSQAALNTLQSDMPSASTTPTNSSASTTPPSSATGMQQTQPPHKHHRPFSFWNTQDND